MKVTFTAKSKNTLPREQVFPTAVSVEYMESSNFFLIQYKHASGRIYETGMCGDYYISKVE